MRTIINGSFAFLVTLAMLFALPASGASVDSCSAQCRNLAATEKQDCNDYRIRSGMHMRLACLKSSHNKREQCLSVCS